MNEWTIHFYIHNRPIDPEFLTRIGSVADEFGVSMDQKTCQAIAAAAQKEKRSMEEFIRKADEFALQVGSIKSNSADDICIERDELDEDDDQSNQPHRLSHEEFICRASEISRRIGPVNSDSADFLRSIRDSL